ncbi:MAG: PAS domain S-box protein [Bacteroidota bacterium]
MSFQRKTKAVSLSRRLLLYLLGAAFISAIVMGIFWIKDEVEDYNFEVSQLKQNYADAQKIELKSKILQIKDYIHWMHSQPLQSVSQIFSQNIDRLKSVFANATVVNGNLSQAAKDSISSANIPLCIMDGSGKMVFSFSPFAVADKVESSVLENSLLSQIKTRTKGKGIVSKFKVDNENDSTLQGIGYYDNEILPGYKIASVVPSSDLKTLLNDHILDTISQLRFTENEYVFVNTMDGKALVTHGKYNKPAVDILNSGNEKWIKIYKVEQTAAHDPDGVFYTYVWPKLATRDSNNKTSYFSYVPWLKWIIGSGFYEDDVNALIEQRRKTLFADLQNNLYQVGVFLLISFFLCLMLVSYFTRRFTANIEAFNAFFKKAATENIAIDRSRISYTEFNGMAEAADHMIEDRQQWQAKLQEATYKWINTFNSIQHGIVLLDSNQNIMETNQAFLDMIGKTREEVLNNHCWFCVHGTKCAIDGCPFILSQQSKKRESIELKMGEKEFEITVDPILDKHNNLIAAVHIVANITERKHAEENIKKLNRVYALLSSISQTIVHTRDKQVLFDEACRIAVDNGGFVMAWVGMLNHATQKVEVIASSGKIGEYLKNIGIDLNDEDAGSGPTGQTIKTGIRVYSNNIEMDSHMKPWRRSAFEHGFRSLIALPIKVWGKTVGAYTLYSNEINFFNVNEIRLLDEMALDISFALEFIESENSRKQAAEELKESEEKYRTIFENVQDVFYQVDKEGIVVDISPSIKYFSEFSRDEIIGKHVEIIYNDPEDREKLLAEISKSGELKDYEIKLKTKTGEVRHVSVNARMVLDKDNNLLHTDGALRDISERKAIEVAKQKQIDDLLHFGKIARDRELKMVDLKREINELLIKLGEQKKYDTFD